MKSFKKFVSLVCVLALFTPVLALNPAAADAAVQAVTFDSGGRFVDALDNADQMAFHSGITFTDGSVTGADGTIVYAAGESEFQSISIDVTFNKWVCNYDKQDISVFETVYNEATGTFVDGNEVELVRQVRPAAMSDHNIAITTYESGPIPEGTKYLRIVLPEDEFFANAEAQSEFKVDEIRLYDITAPGKPAEWFVDELNDFSKLAGGPTPVNLALKNATDIWDSRTFMDTKYAERQDATLTDSALTYEAPAGQEFLNAYVEGYYNFIPSHDFEVWTSADGENYTNATQASHYQIANYSYNGNWFPTVLKIGALPAGTRFVQIRLPAFTADELWGLKHPRMTTVALGYGVLGSASHPGEEPIDPEVVYPAETTIKFAAEPLTIDGIVEADENGSPSGEWAGALSESVTGVVYEKGAEVYLKYDYDNLYVGAKIKDPTPMINTSTGSNIWNGDNLEIFLGTEDLNYVLYPNKKLTMIPSDVQVVLSGGIDNGPQSYVYKDGVFTYPNIHLSVVRDADGKGYTIEAAVPLNTLGITDPWNGKSIIMNSVLNEGDSLGRGQWGWTTQTEANKKSRSLWGLAHLEPVGPPPVEVTVNAAVEAGTNVATVSGKTANVQAKDVTIVVTDPSGDIAYIDQATSDAEGDYAFTFPINGELFESGDYTVTVGGDGVLRTNSATFSLAADTAAPSEVSGFAVTGGNGKLTVSWMDPANADFDYAIVGIKNGMAPLQVAKGVHTAEITGLANDAAYTVVVKTVDLSGNISAGSEAAGRTAVVGSISPSPTPTTGSGTDGGTADNGTVQVDLSGKKPDVNGNLRVELPDGAKALQIPVGQLSIVGNGNLIAYAGDASASIPAEVLAAAAKLGDAADGFVTLRLEKSDAEFTIGISLVTKGGQTKELTSFAKPVSLTLPVLADADDELLGVYFVREGASEPEYAGGRGGKNGKITASVSNPGTYKVLEYDKPFEDVPAGHWAKRPIQVLTAWHIVNGVNDDSFKPGAPITRADFALLLARALGLEEGASSGFTDVDPDKYYAGAIAALRDAKLINGRGGDRFDPTAEITREEMIVLIVKAYAYSTGETPAAGNGQFADDSAISDWARDAVNAVKALDLVQGKGNNAFDPKAGSQRSETAQLIYNFLKRTEG